MLGLKMHSDSGKEDGGYDWIIICIFIVTLAFLASIIWSRQANWEIIFQSKIKQIGYSGQIDIDSLIESAKHRFIAISFFANVFDIFGMCIIYGLILHVILALNSNKNLRCKYIDSLNIVSIGMIAYFVKHIANFVVLLSTNRAHNYAYNDLLPRMRVGNVVFDAMIKSFDVFFGMFIIVCSLTIKKRYGGKVAKMWALWGIGIMALLAFLIS